MLVVKVPAINGLGKTAGCEKAPDAVLEALKNIYSNESGKEVKDLEIKEIKVDNSNIEESNQNIFNEAKKIFESDDKIIFLGGDHSISYSTVKAFASCFDNPGLIVLDAHADCTNSFKPPTNEDWLRVLIESGFPASNVILVGLRNVFKNKEEKEMPKINIFSNKELFEDIHKTCDLIMESARKFDALYVSVDLDVVDPAYAPAVTYPEPAGLSSRELIYLIQRLNLLKNMKAVDIVEISPKKDMNNMTTKLGAKIVAELA